MFDCKSTSFPVYKCSVSGWYRGGHHIHTSLYGWQSWAVASGKINEFPNNKARWKTNFRCALNNLSVRFKMVQDNSKNSDDPHKIYEIINTECKWNLIHAFSCATVYSLNANQNGFVSLSADNYESLPTQDSQEDSDMTPDTYSSPVECFPLGTEVQYSLERAFTSLCWEFLCDVCFHCSTY